MNFQQLRYIVAVERHQNFRRAAIECGVAQSTLSKAIQRLEKEYGIIIFDRTRKPVVPTLKGIDLISTAKEILQKHNEFVRIAEQRKNKVSGHVQLAITEILAPYLAPHLIQALAAKYPDLHLELLELSNRRIEDLLVAEEVDAAVMVAPSLAKEYFEHKLYREELLVYSTELSAAATDGRVPVEAIDLDAVLIHQDLRDILKRQRGRIVKEDRREEGYMIKYPKGNLETIRNIIQTNGGAMFVPTLARPFFPEVDRVHIFPLSGIELGLDVSLIASRGFEKNRIVKRLIEEIVQIASVQHLKVFQ